MTVLWSMNKRELSYPALILPLEQVSWKTRFLLAQHALSSTSSSQMSFPLEENSAQGGPRAPSWLPRAPEGSQKAQTLNILVTLAVWSKSATLLLKLIPGKSKLSFKQELLVRLSYNADTCCTLINVKVAYFTKYIGKKLLKEKEEQTKKLNNASEKSNFLFFSSKALSEQNTFGNSWMFTVPIYITGSLNLWDWEHWEKFLVWKNEPKSLQKKMHVSNTKHFCSASLRYKLITRPDN